MNSQISLEQQISDKINASFDGYFLSCPGKNGVTVIENSNPDLREYKIVFTTGVPDTILCTFDKTDADKLEGKSLEEYRKLWSLVAAAAKQDGFFRFQTIVRSIRFKSKRVDFFRNLIA